MVVPPHRSGGQAQYIESPVLELDQADPVAAPRPHFRCFTGNAPAAYRSTFAEPTATEAASS
jgi:hypothetical protein